MLHNKGLISVSSRALFGVAASIAFTATANAANILVNPSFESPSTDPGVEYAGAGDGWTSFGGAFTINNVVEPNVKDGVQTLKVFGEAGAYQKFAVADGDVVTGTAWVLNSSGDPMAGGQIAAVNLEWFNAAGGSIAVSFGSSIDASATLNEWTQIGVVDALAPEGATEVQLTLITGPFGEGGPGGAPRFDDAFLEITPVPVPAAVWLFGSGLLGLVGVARRRKSKV